LQENTRERVPVTWAVTQNNLAEVYREFFNKDREPRHLDDALEGVDWALEEFRKAKVAFLIEQAKRLRKRFSRRKLTEHRPARRSQNSANVAPPDCSRGSCPL
jgi:hypothetical protein